MASGHTGNHFGDISIEGSARALLGDTHTHNTYYICKAVFTGQEKAEHSANLGAVSGEKRLRDGDFQKSLCGHMNKRQRLQINATETVHHHSNCYALHSPDLLSTSTQDVDTLLESSIRQTRLPRRTLPQVAALVLQPSHEQINMTTMRSEVVARGLMAMIVEKVKRALQASISPWLSLTGSAAALSSPASTSDTVTIQSNSQNQALITSHDAKKSMQELAALVLLLISCASYRNLTSKDMSKVVAKFQEDKLLPLWTWMLGIGIARYLYLGHISCALSALNGDYIILEDAFQSKRRVSMSTCEDYSILKAFLEVHYRGRAGEPLVKAGKFNMTLNSRRGLALRQQDWSTKGRIPAGTTVVMSIFITTDDAKCTACQTSLDVTPMGEFFCQPCKRFYRDYDALKFFTDPFDTSSQEIPVVNDVHNRQVLQRIEEIDPAEEESDLEHEIDSLKNIDLRILPRYKKHDTDQALLSDDDNDESVNSDGANYDSDSVASNGAIESVDGSGRIDADTLSSDTPLSRFQPSLHPIYKPRSANPDCWKICSYCGMKFTTLEDSKQHYEVAHRLEDYQLQLLLLEQQNKKRLIEARQEVADLTHRDLPSVQPRTLHISKPSDTKADFFKNCSYCGFNIRTLDHLLQHYKVALGLEDYHLQIMWLELHNKKRLMRKMKEAEEPIASSMGALPMSEYHP